MHALETSLETRLLDHHFGWGSISDRFLLSSIIERWQN